MHTPEEAVGRARVRGERRSGFKAVLCAGYVQRPFDALADKDPEVSRYAFWLDQFGIDSAYDYDPVWAKAQELGVSIAFHSGFIGMTPYRSISSYVFNHLSMLAEGQQSLGQVALPRRGDTAIPGHELRLPRRWRGVGRRAVQRHRRPLGEAEPRRPAQPARPRVWWTAT